MADNLQKQITNLINSGKTAFFLDENYQSGKEFHGCFIAKIENDKVTITDAFPKKSILREIEPVTANFEKPDNTQTISTEKLIQGAQKLGYVDTGNITGFFTANIKSDIITVIAIYLGKCDKSAEEQTLLIYKALSIADVLRINAKDLRKVDAKNTVQIRAAFINYQTYYENAHHAYTDVSGIKFIENQIYNMNKTKITNIKTNIDNKKTNIAKDWEKINWDTEKDLFKNKTTAISILRRCAGLLEEFAELFEHYRYADVEKKPVGKSQKKGGRTTRKLRPRNRSDKARFS